MARSIALCLEDLDATRPSDRFVRCVALVGRQPGLRLGTDGAVAWQGLHTGGSYGDERAAAANVPPDHELWVSADDKLILFRPEGAAPIVVDRAGRRLEVPVGKPVVLIDGDLLELGARRLRVHVHGPTDRCHGPEPLAPRSPTARRLAAAVVAMGAAVASCEVRENPPDIEVAPAPSGTTSAPGGPPDAEAGAGDADADGPRDPAGDAALPDGSATSSGTAAAAPSSTQDGGRAAAPVPKPKPPAAAPKPQPIEVRDYPPYM